MMSSERPLGLAVVGTGIGRLHAYAIRDQVQGATLEVVWSRRPDRAERLVSAVGAGIPTNDFNQVLENPNVDVVLLCTPPDTHRDMASAAFAAGKHVYVEKPLARTTQEASQIIDAAHRHGRSLGCGHNQRFFRHYQDMKRAIDAGKVGRPVLLDACVHVFGEISGFRTRHEPSGGGTLIDSGIHKFDLMRWMLGDVVAVHCMVGNKIQHQMQDEDMALVHLEFAHGQVGSFVCSWSSHDDHRREAISIYGDAGSIHAEDHTTSVRRYVHDDNPKTVSQVFNDTQQASMGRIIQAFCDAIREGTPPPVTGEDGLQALRIVEAAYASAREGTRVPLDTVGGAL